MTAQVHTGLAGLTATIPTAGDRPELRRAVQALLKSAASAGGPAEVLVVVNGRRSVPVLEHIDSPMLRVLFMDERNVSLARNTAIAAALHDTILFTDDDGVVGPDWCAQLRAGLDRPGRALVAGPVRIPASGPVTAFLDYQRPFDAAPDGTGGVLHPVTLNCGIRRDRLPGHVRFDADLRFGQDTDFGHAARAAGASTAWLADSPPVLHVLTNHFDEIGLRFLQYGAGIASIALKRQQDAALTAVFLSSYQAMTGSRSSGLRRFSEFTRPRIRDTFTVLDYLLTACLFIGYLQRTSAELGLQLITVDAERLHAACLEIADSVLLAAGGHTGGDWGQLGPDYRMLGHAAAPVPAAIDQIKAVLGEHARPAAGPAREAAGPAREVAGPAREVAGPAREVASPARQAAGGGTRGTAAASTSPAGDVPPSRDRAWAAWRELRTAGGPITTADLERAFRSAGVAFKEGCRQVETRLLRERPSPERERPSPERERPSREQSSPEPDPAWPDRPSPERERPSRERSSREQSSREQPSREQPSREQSSPEPDPAWPDRPSPNRSSSEPSSVR